MVQTTSEEFQKYANSRSSNPPSTGSVPVRNIEVSYKSKKTARRGERAARGTGRFSGRALHKAGKEMTRAGNYLGSSKMVAAGAATQNAGKEITAASGGEGKMSRSSLRAISAVRGGKRFKAKGFNVKAIAGNGKAKIRATRTSMTLISSGFTFWIWFQLPLALISLVFFGLRIAIDSFFTANVTKSDAGIFETLYDESLNFLIATAKGGMELIATISAEVIKIDITKIGDPATYFMATYLVVWGLAMAQLFIVYLLYKLSRVEPLGGKGSGLKYGMLVLAIIGYSIPVLNIFPWVIFWILAVWKNPE